MVRLDLHLELEEKTLRHSCGKEACVLFLNRVTDQRKESIQTIAGRNDVIFLQIKTITPVL